MAHIRAFRSGDWQNTTTIGSPWWSGTQFWPPSAGDSVFANSFTVFLSSSIAMPIALFNHATPNIVWADGATAASSINGTFVLSDSLNLTVSSIGNHLADVKTAVVTITGTTINTISANDIAGSTGIRKSNGGLLNVYCTNLVGGQFSDNYGIDCLDGYINVYSKDQIRAGNSGGGPCGAGLRMSNYSNGFVRASRIMGGARGGTDAGIYYLSTGVLNVDCDVLIGLTHERGTGPGILHEGIGTLIVNAKNVFNYGTQAILSTSSGVTILNADNIVAGTVSPIVNTNVLGLTFISGNLESGNNGSLPFDGHNIICNKLTTNSYIKYTGTGVNWLSDGFYYRFVQEAFNSFSIPPISSVKVGVLYGGGSRTGVCNIPPTSAVAFGLEYGSRSMLTGTAINRSSVIFNTLISSLSTTSSVGEQVKKSATVESTGHLIASFSK